MEATFTERMRKYIEETSKRINTSNAILAIILVIASICIMEFAVTSKFLTYCFFAVFSLSAAYLTYAWLVTGIARWIREDEEIEENEEA